MYESPVNLYEIDNIISDITKKVENDTETYVMESIKKVGIDVDKDELIKALQYDRDQYNKGYADAKAEIKEQFIEILKTYSFEHTLEDEDYFMGKKKFKFINVDAFNDLLREEK